MDWDEGALALLRSAVYRRDGAVGVELLRSRPLGPVLQYAGDVLVAALRQGIPGADGYARKCVEELTGRDLPGDAELARVLTGEPDTLVPVPVDLAELGTRLEGEPGEGSYVVDLVRGEVLSPDEAGPEFDAGSESYEPDRWLPFWPEGRVDGDEERQRGRARAWLAQRGYRVR